MPPDLRVRVEEFVVVEHDDDNGFGFHPDVRVIERPSLATGSGPSAAGAAEAEPLVVPMERESATQRSLRIIDSGSGHRVITAIEVLSHANKCTEAGRRTYRRKQRDLLDGAVNLVEIDLLREGHYVMAVPSDCVPIPYQVPFRICVVRATKLDQAEVYRTSLRERLPAIRIPLRPSDADVTLDVQSLIDQSYENGGYDDIDYGLDPVPSLPGDDATWADALLREKGLRGPRRAS